MEPVSPHDYKTLERFEVAQHARGLAFSCFGNQPFLRSDRACRWLAVGLDRAMAKHGVDLWAYCFMPTHAHVLVYPRSDEPDMSSFCASFKKSSGRQALAWVREHAPLFLSRMRDEQPNGRVGYRFWQRGGGYDRNLTSARAIWNVVDYIHRNPLEAGLCGHAADWKWSSAAFYMRRGVSPVRLRLDKLPARP